MLIPFGSCFERGFIPNTNDDTMHPVWQHQKICLAYILFVSWLTIKVHALDDEAITWHLIQGKADAHLRPSVCWYFSALMEEKTNNNERVWQWQSARRDNWIPSKPWLLAVDTVILACFLGESPFPHFLPSFYSVWNTEKWSLFQCLLVCMEHREVKFVSMFTGVCGTQRSEVCFNVYWCVSDIMLRPHFGLLLLLLYEWTYERDIIIFQHL